MTSDDDRVVVAGMDPCELTEEACDMSCHNIYKVYDEGLLDLSKLKWRHPDLLGSDTRTSYVPAINCILFMAARVLQKFGERQDVRKMA